MDTPTIIGIAGIVVGVIGSILGFLQWRRSHRREEPDLWVRATFKSRSEAGIAILIALRNRGRYPAFIDGIELILKSGARLRYKDTRGLGLEQQLEVTEAIPRDVLFALHSYMKEIVEPTRIKRIEIREIHGGVYKYPKGIREKREFKRQIASEWTEELKEYWESHT